MKYVKVSEYYPHENVDVHVVTADGKKGVARYWKSMDKWLTQDQHLTVNDTVVKWRYADAVSDVKPGDVYSKNRAPYKFKD